MELKPNYLINEKTVLFKGIYYKNGDLFTEVVEGDDRFIVARSPLQIIKHTLLCYGSDFKGALNSAKHHLGKNKKMYPMKVNETLDIWIFPSKSYNQHNCIWFVLNHVHGTDHLDRQKTKVYLSYNHTFDIKMREYAFKTKRSNAEELRKKVTSSTKNSLNFFVEPKKGFHLTDDSSREEEYKKK